MSDYEIEHDQIAIEFDLFGLRNQGFDFAKAFFEKNLPTGP